MGRATTRKLGAKIVAHSPSQNQLQYKMHGLPAVFLLSAHMPGRMVTELNCYLDKLLQSKDKSSNAGKLVGQISHGEQLVMDRDDPDLRNFRNLVEVLGSEYIKQFSSSVNCNLGKRRVEMDSLWSVHSFERDYNPLHDHLTKTLMGISFAAWTKIPEQIDPLKNTSQEARTMANSSGVTDGAISFHYGNCSSRDTELLRHPQTNLVNPHPGLLMMFPSWLQHVVYPFEGKGERRTIAGNMNVFTMMD